MIAILFWCPLSVTDAKPVDGATLKVAHPAPEGATHVEASITASSRAPKKQVALLLVGRSSKWLEQAPTVKPTNMIAGTLPGYVKHVIQPLTTEGFGVNTFICTDDMVSDAARKALNVVAVVHDLSLIHI